MKKLMLAVISLAALTAGSMTGHVQAASPQTITIHANGSVCEETGSITPEELSFAYGQQVTLAFKNAERMGVEIRNIPGGTFEIPGNQTVERSFQAKGSFVYAAWSSEGDCEKATARIKVNGGWWLRAWPWLTALLGSIIIVLLVRHLGRKHRTPPPTSAGRTAE